MWMDHNAKKERNNNMWEGLLREGRGICVKTFYCLLYKTAGERDQLLLEHSPGKHLVWKLVPHLLDCSQLWIKEGNWCSAAEWGECPSHSDLYCHGKTPTDILMPSHHFRLCSMASLKHSNRRFCMEIYAEYPILISQALHNVFL